MPRSLRPGLAPIIVVAVLVAVTLIISVACVTWLMGFWSTHAGRFMMEPLIRVSFGNLNSSPVLQLYVVNQGASSETILKVMIKSGNGFYVNTTQIEIPAGFNGYINYTKWVKVNNPYPLGVGDLVRVYIYTVEHGVFFEDLVVSG